jgi:glycosyltransferase 2 family protein
MAARMTNAVVAVLRQALGSVQVRTTLRLVVGVGVLIAVLSVVGAGPFLAGLRRLDARTIGAALVLAALATAAAAWRWRLLAARLGVELGLPAAIGMYYRSQFLNTVLPGGIVGDVHRGISAGAGLEGTKRSLRAVAIERLSGQVVQVALALAVLACFAVEFEGYLLFALVAVVALAGVTIAVAWGTSSHARTALRFAARELRAGLGSMRVSLQVAAASVVVIACHVTTFVIAAEAVGAKAPPLQLVTLALVVLLGASIPLNVGGWGPREGIAGWAFALAGLGASAGVSASTLFGALTIIAVSPGAVVTVVAAVRRRTATQVVPTIAQAAGGTSVFALTSRQQENSP